MPDLRDSFSIYRISLYKKFRSIRKSTLPNASWRVFGHYDAMSVVAIPWTSYINPLEAIYHDSEQVTLRNSGIVKEHVIYAFGYSKDRGSRFLRKSHRHPVFLVSLIHLNHPFRSNKSISSTSILKIKEQIENEIRSLTTVPFLVCFSVDCNDLIIFWSGDSISEIMQYVSAVSVKFYDDICEVFTIQACSKRALTNPKNRILSTWEQAEKSFESVNVYLQGPHHGELINQAHVIKRIYLGSSFCEQPKISILSGRDDVILRFEKMSVSAFVQLYCEHPQSQIAQILDGLVSRTVIEIPLPNYSSSSSNNLVSKKEDIPYYVPELLSDFQKVYKKLNQTEQSQLIWAIPLQELLIEFSNIQVSNAAYDIFAQAAESQKRFIKMLCNLLEDQKHRLVLLNPDSRTVQLIQRYIQGWSQLSFHAMHSEWQLTQTSDVNRLYLFPAKLNRLYCAFMKQSSVLLSNTSLSTASSSSRWDNSCYFLSPKLCSSAEFISIFRECDNIPALILGEIPADLVYSPQILLPILIHEAGHYIGGTLRKRDDRYDLILSSSMQYVFQQMLDIDLLTEHSTTGIELIHYLIYEWKVLLRSNNILFPKTTYGVDITIHIKEQLINTFFGNPKAPYSKLNRFALSAIENNSKYQMLDRSLQILKATDIILTDNSKILFNTGDERSLSEFVDQLITIYREAFCDLCMIKSLNMECGDYLNVICRSYRLNAPFGQREYEIISEMTFWERVTSVIETIWCSDILAENFDTLMHSSYCSVKDAKCVHMLLNILYTHKRTNKIDSVDRNPNRFLRGSLKKYLQMVSCELDTLIQKKNSDFDLLRSVYKSLSRDFWICDESAITTTAFQDFQKLIQDAEKK